MIPRPRFFGLLLAGTLAGALALGSLALPAPALAVSDDPVLRRMDAVLEENARLREDAWKAHKNGDREAARQAADGLAASEERLERARAESLAHVANVSPAQVEALRKDGKSWGQAASELGVHPGFLGVGKVPMYESLPQRKAKKAEVAEAKAKGGKRKAGAKGKARDEDREPAAKGKTAKAVAEKSGDKAKGKPGEAKRKAKGSEPKAKAAKGAPEKAKGKAKPADQPEKKAKKARKKAENG